MPWRIPWTVFGKLFGIVIVPCSIREQLPHQRRVLQAVHQVRAQQQRSRTSLIRCSSRSRLSAAASCMRCVSTCLCLTSASSSSTRAIHSRSWIRLTSLASSSPCWACRAYLASTLSGALDAVLASISSTSDESPPR